MIGEELSASGLDVLRFVFVEPDPTDCVGELLRIAIRIVGWGFVVPEQIFGHFIDLFVGALGREDGGHKEFQGIGEDELAVGIGIGRLENLADAFTPSEAICFGFPGHALRYR